MAKDKFVKPTEQNRKRIERIEKLIGINHPNIDNIHYLIDQIKALANDNKNKGALLSLCEQYHTEKGIIDDFADWMEARATKQREAQKKIQEEVQKKINIKQTGPVAVKVSAPQEAKE